MELFHNKKTSATNIDRLEEKRAAIHAELAVIDAEMEMYSRFGELFNEYKKTVLDREHIALALKQTEISLDEPNSIRHIRGQIAEIIKLKRSKDSMNDKRNKLMIALGETEAVLIKTKSAIERAEKRGNA